MNIFEAAENGDIERIKTLLNEGVDINIKNMVGWSPLFHAIRGNRLDTIKFLLENGIDLEIKSLKGKTALSYAVEESYDINIIKLLLEKGSDVNTRTNLASTPIMLAARYGGRSKNSLDIIKLLLEWGADINAKDNDGYTALSIAANFISTTSSIDTIKILLENGANIFEVTNDGKNAIDFCKTGECKQFLSKYAWNKLYERDLDTAIKYSRQSIFPKDVWTLILLNRRQQLLCQNLSSDKNKEVLKFFAIELNIPITGQMTKAQLCGLISKQIVYGKIYHKTDDEMNRIKRDMIRIAKSFGIDTNRSIEKIAKDLGKVLI